jgi:tRNA pseudouridine13 synthase
LTDSLAHAHGRPPLQARLRSSPEDFVVEELPNVAPDGDGDHLWLEVRKRNTNTDWLAKELARFAGVNPVDVGYAGIKDRDAVTTQAFTIHLPGREAPDWAAFPHAEVSITPRGRHRRKLKRGALAGNRFRLTLREVQGDSAAAEHCLTAIRDRGVPNYYGEQRFGLGGANVARAEAMFAGQRVDRNTRSMLLSAARSHCFNAVLNARVHEGNWDQGLDGEIWCLAGSRSWFGPEAASPELQARLAAGDISPSGPLWGRGPLPTADAARMLEERVLAPFSTLKTGLEAAGMAQDRRALRLLPEQLQWSWLESHVLVLDFRLPPGAYATVLMRELVA